MDRVKKSFKEFKIVSTFGRKGRSLEGIDVSNKDEPIFNDRCVKFGNAGGKVLTVNERRNTFYPNNTMSCGSNSPKKVLFDTNGETTKEDEEVCVFEGLDENFYSILKRLGNTELY